MNCLTKSDFHRALRQARDEAQQRENCEYDSLQCLKYAAQIELCNALANALGLELGEQPAEPEPEEEEP